MTPLRVNRRRFLGSSVAAGLALSQGAPPVEAGDSPRLARLGLLGLGNRGTTLLRTALELPGVQVVAVADHEAKHRSRAQGIVEKATKARPEGLESAERLFARDDIDAVLVALPCDQHAAAYLSAIEAGKHLYAEKPLAPTIAECDAVIAGAARHPEIVVHVGYQRRSNPRYREVIELIQRGEFGSLRTARGQWISSNGPMNGHEGWLGRRERSGDWMVEQAVHVWDVLHWAAGGLPEVAHGFGRRDVFKAIQPERDVTDQYSVLLSWPDGFHASFTQSWNDPADEDFTGTSLRLVGDQGGFDFGSGAATFRDRGRPRRALHAGSIPDTKLALRAFLDAARAPEPPPPPLTLVEARAATRIGLMVRDAVDRGMKPAASERA